ncbi:hypothetical protein INS49_014805 [Diaporthe citri]|uniref:uncharacterized protein n=1 Tax=Diaporthe citri TaxID=83186 RepID=UPI001C806D2B|nr:uncharacterized protein INS49_014805 [Diaporthe citri]KAG6356930.1 hypothetical protein INS49_014805 [Diaporthe citri]
MMASTKSSPPSDTAVAAEVIASVDTCRALRKRVKEHQRVKAEDPFPAVMNSLPPREKCDRLVESYLRTFELMYRVVHIPSFRKQYTEYWERPQAASAGFRIKILLILALGCSVEREEEVFMSVCPYVSQWVFAAQWWLTGPAERSTAGQEGLQVHCLLILARQAHSIGNSGSNWTLSGSLLHFACMQGLHRDPKHFPELSFVDAETRRRLWATVLELLLQTSIDAYMSPMFCLDDFDTEPPSNLNDAEFDQHTSVPPPPRPEAEFTQTSIQVLLHQSIRCRLDTMKFLNKSRGTEQCYDTALRLGTELQSFSQKSEVLFHSRAGQKNNIFHKKLTDMILHRAILLLHRPFVLRGAGDPRFHFSRKVGLESAMVLLSHLGDLDASSGTVDEFARLTMMSTGTFKGAISLDAITTVCLEVLSQLYEEGGKTGPEHASRSVVVDMARASRALMVQTLEHVQKQLERLVARGDPSLKRYVFLNTTLAQIRALGTGNPPEATAREALKDSLQACRNMLEQYIHTAQLPEYSPLTSGLFDVENNQVLSNDELFNSLIGDPAFNLEFDPSRLLSMWDDQNIHVSL